MIDRSIVSGNYVVNIREHQLMQERDCRQLEIRLLSVILGRQRKESLRGVAVTLGAIKDRSYTDLEFYRSIFSESHGSV